ncbi:sugar porter family MFS transporter [Pseudonocardia alni]|uniref:sugar porter family MFS transporter n=1 Tax=Pseudonocardia alni TaxID=33907 RepID=UPI0033CE307A
MNAASSGTSVSEVTLPPLGTGPFRRKLGLISVIACLGGLLFGYDTGVANGAEGPMQAELGLSLIQLGVVISSLVFAAAVGSLIFGRVSDAVGRRRTIIMLASMFFVGALLVVFAPGGPEFGTHTTFGLGQLIAGRVLLGLAVGGASTTVPVYLAELAPYEIRGSITGRNELAIVSGQLAAFVVNAILGITLGHLDGVWRIMFAVCVLPAVALFVGMLRMPESPRWLVDKGREAEALAVLQTVRLADRAEAELREVKLVAAEENTVADPATTGIRAIVTNSSLLKILLIGMGLRMAQEFTGVAATIMYYGQRVLIEAGFPGDSALIANVTMGVASVVGGVIALRNMDRLDRRTTFLIGFSLVASFHLLIGLLSVLLPEGFAARPYILLVAMVALVFSMQTFLNVAIWVWVAEIFPLHMRGAAIGISVAAGWLVTGTLSLFVPALIDAIHITGVFFMYGVINVVSLLFVRRFVPETRGRTLESLEMDVTSGRIHEFRTRG